MRIKGECGYLVAVLAVMAMFGAVGCSSDGNDPDNASQSTTTEEQTAPATDSPAVGTELSAGAASRSILPTVDGKRDYLTEAPGWPVGETDPNNPGVFVPVWDQGRVDVGNGSSDSAWVHDDLAVTAVAVQRGPDRVVMVSSDTYMHFAPDADEIVARARRQLDAEWADAPILVAATHNHHGPDTAFSINDDWYSEMADQAADAIAQAVEKLEPARMSVANGSHSYGVNDARDPIVMDTRLNVMTLEPAEGDGTIATIVQWNSHPETTLGWNPAMDADDLAAACATKKWEGDDCSAEGRYLTADYPGVLRARLAESTGGEVLYFNGPLGSQIGPGQAPTWLVDEQHPVPTGPVPLNPTAPDGAVPLTKCDDGGYFCRSFAKTESIGTELANAVTELIAGAKGFDPTELTVETEPFFTRLNNIGFRVLLSDETLGWQTPTLYTCDGHPSEESCSEAEQGTEEDPVITPLADSNVVVGDVVQSRVSRVDLGDIGFIFMPGELPPELVIGLPDDFSSAPDKHYREPQLHAVGDEYKIPGNLLSLVDESVTFTVGLGGDELGYFVPIDEYRLLCIDLALPSGATCADLAARTVIPSPDYIGGRACSDLVEEPASREALGADEPAVAAICRYGQALGRELGEPDGHYEETNSAGWDMVDDLWAAAQRLFDR